MADATIVDWTGQPARARFSQGLYQTPSSHQNSARLKPVLRQRTFENITPWQRRDLINWSWGIYCRIPNVAAALDYKTDFACSDACYVEYRGSNKAWGKAFECYINDLYYQDCNLLGEQHDFHTTLAELSIALETHGQLGWVFDEDSGKLRTISANMIGNGFNPDSKPGEIYALGKGASDYSYWGLNTVNYYGGGLGNYLVIERGPFAGYRIIDGIILDRNLRRVGCRVMGFDESGKPGYADLPNDKMGLVYEPKFNDQIMGYPGLSDLIESVGTVDDWNYYIGQAMKLSAAMAVTRKTKDGRAPTNGVTYSTADEEVVNADGSTSTTTKVYAREIIQAGIVELATDNNEEIGSVPFDRPSMNEEAFIERIETGFFAKHWPRQFIYSKGFGRAEARIAVVQARQRVWKRHKTLVRFAKAWINRKVAQAMDSGELPKNNAGFDPYNFVFSMPAEISVDEGNDAKIDLEKLGRGATSHRIICAKDGHNDEKIEDDNFEKRDRMMAKAEAMAKKHPDWNAKEILVMMDNMGNPNQQQQVQPQEPDGDEAAGKTAKKATD